MSDLEVTLSEKQWRALTKYCSIYSTHECVLWFLKDLREMLKGLLQVRGNGEDN